MSMSFSSGPGGIWSWPSNWMKPVLTQDCSDGVESPESPCCELFKELCKLSAFDGPDSSPVRNQAFETLYKNL